jgi:hypothetical protein
MSLLVSSHSAVAPPAGRYFALVLTQPALDAAHSRRRRNCQAKPLATSGMNFFKLRRIFVAGLANTFTAMQQDFSHFRFTYAAFFALGHNK